MINIFFKIFVIFLLYACADKSLIISEDRDEVFPGNKRLIIIMALLNQIDRYIIIILV